jgi:4-hydroxythreonine-4-phosphate dehydrogenase
MNYKPILVVSGEPNSIFLEIYFKTLKKYQPKNPLILITSYKLLILQMKKLKIKKKICLLDVSKLEKYSLNNKSINLININFDQKKAFEKITKKSNRFIKNCFDVAFKLIKEKYSDKLINGPISKKNFLNKKLLGMTEYISEEFSVKKNAMLIYNKTLSVCPLTTHLPLKFVAKNITKNSICEKIILINKFYKKNLNKNPNIAVLGLNPHCESVSSYNEDEKVIKPTIQHLSKLGHRISGPFPADTIFLNENRKKYDVILGMYHDQVLTPIKTLFEYNAINITLGLPFIRISPDHGPNEQMLGKNLSNPLSLIQAISFMDKN